MADTRLHKRLILHKTVVLVGMMGAGKTAVGRALAARLGVAFRDSDHELEQAADRTIAEIFARDGEAFFRQKEQQVITRMMADTPCVLSTGGGAFLRAENRAAISRDGVSVWLDAELDVLWSRVRGKDTRPLLRTADPRATLAELLRARAPVYAQADLRVASTRDATLEDMAEKVARALIDARPDVLEEKT